MDVQTLPIPPEPTTGPQPDKLDIHVPNNNQSITRGLAHQFEPVYPKRKSQGITAYPKPRAFTVSFENVTNFILFKIIFFPTSLHVKIF